jgi:hypothetical protein
MALTNKDSGATRMAGAPMFQAIQHPELDTLGLVAIRDFLKKRARYLRLVAQNNKADDRNLRLDFINGKPKKAVENLVSVTRPDREQTRDGQVGTQEGLPRVR